MDTRDKGNGSGSWNPFEARFSVSGDGYEIRRGLSLLMRMVDDPPLPIEDWDSDQLVIVEKKVPLGQESKPGKHYNALSVKALHRVIASTGDDEIAILNLIHRFGFFGVYDWGIYEDPSDPETRNRVAGEPVIALQQEIRRLNGLICMWDVLRNKESDEELLHQMIYTKDKRFPLDPPSVPNALIRDYLGPMGEDSMPLDFRFGMKTNPRLAASACLTHIVGEYLAEDTRPQLILGPGGRIAYRALTLLGAAYIHFAQELMGKSDPLIRCASCGKWFPSKHKSRMYCSPACKQKAYRRSHEDNNG